MVWPEFYWGTGVRGDGAATSELAIQPDRYDECWVVDTATVQRRQVACVSGRRLSRIGAGAASDGDAELECGEGDAGR